MSAENIIFRKIKEMSVQAVRPRPVLSAYDVARELSMPVDELVEPLVHLNELKLINFSKADFDSVKLTLLGTVVVRNK
jgi:hypothetical protein